MKHCVKKMMIGICASAIAATALAERNENPSQWYAEGVGELQRTLQLKPNENHAKNIILFIGDGMGMSTVTAARIFDGQLRGENGEENVLSFEELPYIALAKTYNTNQQVPDSAGTMTAIMSGVKTKAGLIGVNQNAQLGNCKSLQGNAVTSFLEQAAKAGMGTGIVTTTRVTHATPAATYAHTPDRNWESDHDMPAQAKEQGCKDIARQLLEFPVGGGIDVVLGGGRSKFMPVTMSDPEGAMGEREDKRDLSAEWVKKYRNAAYVWNEQQFAAIDPSKTEHLLGLFNRSDMSFEVDRKSDTGGEPSLAEMTKKAIAILKKNPQGFFLMIEGGRIDHAHHQGNAYRALDETREFANAVRAALNATDNKETLIIVTADHSHTLTISGEPKRGNPILGKVVGNGDDGKPNDKPAKALDEKPYTTLNYLNGPGALAVRDSVAKDGSRRDLSEVDTTKPDYLQQALIPLSSEGHGGEDVPIYAGGPWAQLFHRTVEQNYIYQVMRYATFERPKLPDRAAGKTKVQKQKTPARNEQ
ncbi:MAG: alkaline phosphatase [Verrucomicrobiaceae bacterium]|nr:alkaline phosphatase [Verrucomicrobiaceae bacterium]